MLISQGLQVKNKNTHFWHLSEDKESKRRHEFLACSLSPGWATIYSLLYTEQMCVIIQRSRLLNYNRMFADKQLCSTGSFSTSIDDRIFERLLSTVYKMQATCN